MIGCADPHGAAMYELFKHGEAKSTPGGSITEGIGLGRVTPVIKPPRSTRPISFPTRKPSRSSTNCSSTKGFASAARPASMLPARSGSRKQLGPGHTIVTMLCDSGNRYQSKLFNPDFMRSKNLPVPEWLEKRSKIERAVREGVSRTDPSFRGARSALSPKR